MTLAEILPLLREPKPDKGGYMAFCPTHDDGVKNRRRSLSVSEKNGKILLHCFAGCQTEDVVKALNLTMVNLFTEPRQSRQKKEIVATYDYRDSSDNLVYQVVRLAPKDFRQRRPDGRGGWIWKMKGISPLPYRLPALLEALERGEMVFVPEGEKDCNKLAALGLPATCNHGGAGKWTKVHSGYFPAGADVIILPDDDEPGREHAQKVAGQLTARGCHVRMLELPGLPEKGDISDWLAAGGTKEDLLRLAAAAREWEPAPGPEEEPGAIELQGTDLGDGKKDKKSQADILVKLAKDAYLFRDDLLEPFAMVNINGHTEIWPARSKFFKRWLVGRYYAVTDKAPNSDAIGQALNVVEAIATFQGNEHKLSLRVAEHKGSFWYDLADEQWRAIKVTPEGWEIVSRPPILFRRYKNTAPQVEPKRTEGGGLARLSKYVNMAKSDETVLLLIYLVTCLIPGVPHVVPVFHGEKGACKSTMMRVIRKIVDPARQELLTFPGDKNELALQLSHNYLPAYDNLDGLQAWQSDMLCCAATGGGVSKRELYTNDDEIILSFLRCVTLNGINMAATRPDLLDRALIFGLSRVAPEDRREEAEFWAGFEKDRPIIMGGLFDTLSGAMKIFPTVKLDKLPRMADFCRWGYAAAEALGVGGDVFLNMYYQNIGRANEEAITGNPIASAVVALMNNNNYWQGRSSKLLDALDEMAKTERINTRAKGWPQAAHVLIKRLKQVQSNLLDAGISCTVTRDEGNKSMVVFQRVRENTSGSSGSSESQA
ncbi:MAG: hypothetical protein AB1815_13475 [Bacillota bacterium]